MCRQRDRVESLDDRADKVCGSCGRRIEWRAKWARDWSNVRWCSDACRSRGVRPIDRELEASILSLLAGRASDATICPSEAARAVAAGVQNDENRANGGADDTDRAEDAWRELMEPARRAARRLVATGEVEVTQGGQVVDPSTAKGAIRIRRAR
jgi:hypothetical protein